MTARTHAALLACAAMLCACAYAPDQEARYGSVFNDYEGTPCLVPRYPYGAPAQAAPTPCAAETPPLRFAPVPFAAHSYEVETVCCVVDAPPAPRPVMRPAPMPFASHSYEVETICCEVEAPARVVEYAEPEPPVFMPPAPLPQPLPEPEYVSEPAPLPPVTFRPAPPPVYTPPPVPQTYPEPEVYVPPLPPLRK